MASAGVNAPSRGIAGRFRGYLPVAVDVETGGFDAAADALLEIAVVLLGVDDEGRWRIESTHSTHVEPFPGANIDPAALEFNGIVLDHPLRNARPEREALQTVLHPVRQAVRAHGCTRAILVGHNPGFDLSFLNAAVKRTGFKRNPFHPFSAFDTATLGGHGGIVLGHSAVLVDPVLAVGEPEDQDQKDDQRPLGGGIEAEREAQDYDFIHRPDESMDAQTADKPKGKGPQHQSPRQAPVPLRHFRRNLRRTGHCCVSLPSTAGRTR